MTGGKVAQIYIPTPEAVQSKLQYEDLYPRHFTQPATYIRFSSTVEDMIGCPYCMTGDDLVFLKTYNQKRGKNAQCTEDEFEEVMNFFEETSQTKQPFATVDNTPVLSYEEMEAEFDETISLSSRRFAKDIYSHWKNQRLLKGNHALMPVLKFETNLETDDADPYVCFRRREVRQVRKTRGRDAQVTEKLKKLRKELEDARHLMSQVKRREVLIREQLAVDRQIFEQRTAVKEIKRKLGIKGDDEELLINQKVISQDQVGIQLTDMLVACAKAQTKGCWSSARPAGDPGHPQASTHASRWSSGGIRSCVSGGTAGQAYRDDRGLHRRQSLEASKVECRLGRSDMAAYYTSVGATRLETQLPSRLHQFAAAYATGI